MTTEALKRGFNLLTAVWPSRYASQAELRAGMVVYADLLGGLTDTDWLAACRQAATTCKFFPVPAELLEIASEIADRLCYERLARLDQARHEQAITDTNRLLSAGTVTEEQAAANRERYAAKVAEAVAAARAGGQKAAQRDSDFWSSGQRRRGRRRMMPSPVDERAVPDAQS